MLCKWDRALFDLLDEGMIAEFDLIVTNGIDWRGESDGYTAAMLAAGANRADILEAALKQGVNPNAKGQQGRSSMFWAVAEKRADLVQLLIRFGATADDDIDEEDGDSALHDASEYGLVEIVELLLGTDHHRSLEFFDYIQRTPLACACQNRHIAIVARLLRAGANVNAYDEDRIGETPLGWLISESIADRKSLDTLDLEISRLLLDAGADPLIRGWMGNTAYSRAKKCCGNCAAQILGMMDEAIARLYPDGPPNKCCL